MEKGLIITGFSGTVGSALVEKLEKNERTLYLVSRGGIFEKKYNEDKKILYSNPYDLEALKIIFLQSSECIHLVNCYPQDKSLNETILEEMQANTHSAGFFAKIAVEAKLERFILASTTAMFYALNDGVENIDEDTALKVPDNFVLDRRSSYALSKYLAEELVKSIIPAEKLLTIRIDNIFGPGAKENTIIPKFIQKISSGENIEVFDWTRSFIYIDDLIKILTDVLKKKEMNGVLNICSPEGAIRLCDLASIIKTFFPNSNSIISINDKVREPHLKFCTKYKYSSVLAMTSLKEGVEKIIKKHER
ncbi:MAG: NAD(P)-dependent oxidoreductase [Parcubacteria group bacterium]|nr:NAD(P)-dependent oxidoreductase [Parcubacteria group bacterium]